MRWRCTVTCRGILRNSTFFVTILQQLCSVDCDYWAHPGLNNFVTFRASFKARSRCTIRVSVYISLMWQHSYITGNWQWYVTETLRWSCTITIVERDRLERTTANYLFLEKSSNCKFTRWLSGDFSITFGNDDTWIYKREVKWNLILCRGKTFETQTYKRNVGNQFNLYLNQRRKTPPIN